MTNSPKRVDASSCLIDASAQTIYQAFIHPDQFVKWLPPKGMTGSLETFNAYEGGTFKMTLTYHEQGETTGKSSEFTDVIEATFLSLIPNKKIVHAVSFDSDDPIYSGEMKQTWLIEPVPEGTLVKISCENVPEGINKADHEEGLRSTLENLASLTEQQLNG